jgi:hypothetical protein
MSYVSHRWILAHAQGNARSLTNCAYVGNHDPGRLGSPCPSCGLKIPPTGRQAYNLSIQYEYDRSDAMYIATTTNT